MELKALNNNSINRTKRPVRVLQFGEGNFLRAFVDWMLDIANEKGITDTSVAVATPRFNLGHSAAALRNQDGLYHVILEGIENGKPKQETRLVSSITEVLAPSDDADIARYKEIIASPEFRFVVSNTTEAGIRYEDDDVLADRPTTFPGKVTNLLWQRYQAVKGAKDKGLVFICCELIEDNGTTLREYVLRHAKEHGMPEDFISWVENDNIFADTLVDRIVPGFPKDNIEEVKASLGYDDNAVVKGELYQLWAIGGKGYETVAKELPLDKAGMHVLFMPSIKEFRDKKVRILNGSHTGMVPMSLQLGCETVMDAFNNADVNRFINTMMEREVLPMIPEDPKELKDFADGILERFYNPYIRHYLKSIALNSLSKWEARNFPTVLDNYVKAGRLAEFELMTFAALLSLYGPGSGFTPEDNAGHIAKINGVWNPEDWEKTVRDIVGSGIFTVDFEEKVPGFSAKTAEYLAAIRNDGMEAALKNFLKAHE